MLPAIGTRRDVDLESGAPKVGRGGFHSWFSAPLERLLTVRQTPATYTTARAPVHLEQPCASASGTLAVRPSFVVTTNRTKRSEITPEVTARRDDHGSILSILFNGTASSLALRCCQFSLTELPDRRHTDTAYSL